MMSKTDRRRFLRSSLASAACAGALLSHEDRILGDALAQGGDPLEGSTARVYQGDPLPHGRIGSLSISRLILGGNLIGGYAHSRDLLYVSNLLRAYNTEPKIFETLALAERSGINTIQVAPTCLDVVQKYRKTCGGTIQAIVCMHPNRDPAVMVREIDDLMARGANALYTHGEVSDRLVMGNDLETLATALEQIRVVGVPAGIGSHSLETPMAVERYGLAPDYYVKTFHPDSYWSATPPENREEWCWYNGRSPDHDGFHDNIFDLDADRTADFFATVRRPWIAFKVLAAGALNPQIGITHALTRGADFVLVGMFDFQVALDVEITVKALRRASERERPWCA